MKQIQIHRLASFVESRSQKKSSQWNLNLAGMICAVFLFCAVAVVAAPAQNSFFTTVVSFDFTDGHWPNDALVQGTDGNLYGTTEYGSPLIGGTVFRLAPGGMLTTLYEFCAQPNCADGAFPNGGVIQANDGNFYGTTWQGGTGSCFGGNSCGTVFQITPGGTLTTLYSFCTQPNCPDGAMPEGGLVQGADGNFYGTTSNGGAGNSGTVFKVTPQGELTTLYSFCSQSGCPDGSFPLVGLVKATDGNFYGSTNDGGIGNSGTLFRISPSGTFSILYRFDQMGSAGASRLIQAADGNLYGMTGGGGTSNQGTIFKITLAGDLTTLHSFNGRDGEYPYAGLVQGSDGNFYGTTGEGGANGLGVVFKFTLAGSLTVLHNFTGYEGGSPVAELMQARDGSFYGTTPQGGDFNDCVSTGCGTVFRVGVARTCATCRQ